MRWWLLRSEWSTWYWWYLPAVLQLLGVVLVVVLVLGLVLGLVLVAVVLALVLVLGLVAAWPGSCRCKDVALHRVVCILSLGHLRRPKQSYSRYSQSFSHRCEGQRTCRCQRFVLRLRKTPCPEIRCILLLVQTGWGGCNCSRIRVTAVVVWLAVGLVAVGSLKLLRWQ